MQNTKMWLNIALLLFVVSIGILLKVMNVTPYGIIFLKEFFGAK
ncbi:hypothetical protein [Gottfriedia luciferensis]|nr:hypothetical protein [Gottfriedia luciferensis]